MTISLISADTLCPLSLYPRGWKNCTVAGLRCARSLNTLRYLSLRHFCGKTWPGLRLLPLFPFNLTEIARLYSACTPQVEWFSAIWDCHASWGPSSLYMDCNPKDLNQTSLLSYLLRRWLPVTFRTCAPFSRTGLTISQAGRSVALSLMRLPSS